VTIYAYKIDPRDPDLGGGYRLRLWADDEEVGGGVFPATPGNRDEDHTAHALALAEGDDWLASRGDRDA